MIQIDIKMPKCCDECFALDDYGDYPFCLISQDQRGYTFNTKEKRMPTCPLKAQVHEALGMPEPDSDIGCWYDITHNYTLEQVVSALKSQELCEDAVSRKYLLDQSYSIKFQTIDESDEEAYREKAVCVEDIEDAPSVQPAPVARVMTLEELIGIYNLRENHSWVYNTPPYLYMDCGKDTGYWIAWTNIISCLERCYLKYIPEDYGKTWRLWTFVPTDEQREKEPWNGCTDVT